MPEIAARELEHALMTSLLAEHPNSCQLKPNTPSCAAAPRYVRRIEEFIEANADQALTAQAMAGIARVSAQSIYEGFRRRRGKTPLGYLKEVRLARAHEALRNADPATASVARLALYASLCLEAITYDQSFASRTWRCCPESTVREFAAPHAPRTDMPTAWPARHQNTARQCRRTATPRTAPVPHSWQTYL